MGVYGEIIYSLDLNEISPQFSSKNLKMIEVSLIERYVTKISPKNSFALGHETDSSFRMRRQFSRHLIWVHV